MVQRSKYGDSTEKTINTNKTNYYNKFVLFGDKVNEICDELNKYDEFTIYNNDKDFVLNIDKRNNIILCCNSMDICSNLKIKDKHVILVGTDLLSCDKLSIFKDDFGMLWFQYDEIKYIIKYIKTICGVNGEY